MRIRQHVNPLKSDLLDIADVPRVDAGPGRALEVELGSAEAHFLIDRARADRDDRVRRRRDPARAGRGDQRRCAPRRASPTCAACSPTCRSTCGRLFADGSVRRFFLNFPDPWFKSRQHKRRVIGPGLMAEIARALAPGGELFVQTDIFALALDAMAALEAGAGVRQRRRRVDVRARATPTARSRAASASARPTASHIWRLLYRRA